MCLDAHRRTRARARAGAGSTCRWSPRSPPSSRCEIGKLALCVYSGILGTHRKLTTLYFLNSHISTEAGPCRRLLVRLARQAADGAGGGGGARRFPCPTGGGAEGGQDAHGPGAWLSLKKQARSVYPTTVRNHSYTHISMQSQSGRGGHGAGPLGFPARRPRPPRDRRCVSCCAVCVCDWTPSLSYMHIYYTYAH